jgi:hypothetical protein
MLQPRGHTVLMQAIPKKRGRKKKVNPEEGWDLLTHFIQNVFFVIEASDIF